MLFREIVFHHSQQRPRIHLRALEAGNLLGNLYPTHTRHWWPIVEDIFHSTQVQALRRLTASLERNEEFIALSVDATLKICMVVQGQASYRAPAVVRNEACINDDESLRRVLTIRGRTGAVIAIVPLRSEDAPAVAEALSVSLSPVALRQVKHVSTDSPTSKLFQELQRICPE